MYTQLSSRPTLIPENPVSILDQIKEHLYLQILFNWSTLFRKWKELANMIGSHHRNKKLDQSTEDDDIYTHTHIYLYFICINHSCTCLTMWQIPNLLSTCPGFQGHHLQTWSATKNTCPFPIFLFWFFTIPLLNFIYLLSLSLSPNNPLPPKDVTWCDVYLQRWKALTECFLE